MRKERRRTRRSAIYKDDELANDVPAPKTKVLVPITKTTGSTALFSASQAQHTVGRGQPAAAVSMSFEGGTLTLTSERIDLVYPPRHLLLQDLAHSCRLPEVT